MSNGDRCVMPSPVPTNGSTSNNLLSSIVPESYRRPEVITDQLADPAAKAEFLKPTEASPVGHRSSLHPSIDELFPELASLTRPHAACPPPPPFTLSYSRRPHSLDPQAHDVDPGPLSLWDFNSMRFASSYQVHHEDPPYAGPNPTYFGDPNPMPFASSYQMHHEDASYVDPKLIHQIENQPPPFFYSSQPPPKSPAPEPETVGGYCAPVREPSAWRLDYIIGTGACGTVFLENVHLRGMKSPELWAVKRIPQTVPNFTFKRYQAEIKTLQALARVSFVRTCIHFMAGIWFNLSRVLSEPLSARMVHQIQLYL